MEHFHLYIYVLFFATAMFAGFIDTLAGGGGLIVLPVLLLNGMSPLTALSTNKIQSSVSELSSSLYFIIKKKINYNCLYLALIYTVIGSFIGTILLQYTPAASLEKMIPIFMLAVLLYYIFLQFKKNIIHSNKINGYNNKIFIIIAPIIGFYNGFFGPATGSIWALVLMKAFKLSLQTATMYAKPLNFAGNITAIFLFISYGHINLLVALVMSIGAFIGGKFGAELVSYKDAKFLKIAFFILISLSTIGMFIKYY